MLAPVFPTDASFLPRPKKSAALRAPVLRQPSLVAGRFKDAGKAVNSSCFRPHLVLLVLCAEPLRRSRMGRW
eukprot:s1514_g8.t1